MNPTSVWTAGEYVQAFSSGIVVIVLALMLFMAYRLYVYNRRATYRKLIFSIGVSLLPQLLNVVLAVGWFPSKPLLTFLGSTLDAISFILLNFSVFELYHKKRPRTQAWFYSLIGICVAISATSVFSGGESLERIWNIGALRSPVLDGFMLALSPLFALMFALHIGQPKRYVLTLSLAFALQLVTVLRRYGNADSTFYETFAALLPVAYFILMFMLLFERVVELLQSAYRSSITDGLTNLFNRRFFTNQLEHALRSGKPVGAIFCDIDNFKKLNDTQGHQQADIVLKQVASILTEETEGIGLAGRYGGEELVAFVFGQEASSLAVAEKIRARIEKETIVTASIGHCQAGKGTSAEKLMKQADEAMYHSKKSGKNRVTDYAHWMNGSS
ncbi:GGDEF domain-containing protein [Cohnella thermotolerans]|uniref:GGDEF domain-containing protein n=1 Tax=Cohnella thermotolerans TaxID=329858 RepID=UPI00041601A2|nr:GGDEF domain-containing protein [Cohnella thermotolerans]